MPAEYIIDGNRGIVFTRGFGTLTDGDLRQHAAALKADPAFKGDFRQFTDFSAVIDPTVTVEGVTSITGRANPFGPEARRAVYVPQ
ncbi:MAG TPA: hypothetical protein VGR50_08160, partial [Terriglobales bacterium]|nr:hypothetical protein [Terriglobales bacterium]